MDEAGNAHAVERGRKQGGPVEQGFGSQQKETRGYQSCSTLSESKTGLQRMVEKLVDEFMGNGM